MDSAPPERLLITGGSGRIGTLVAYALRDRYAITILDIRHPPLDLGLPFVQVDIACPDGLRQHFRDIDVVLHLAANPRNTASWQGIYADNILGTYNVFHAALAAGCSRVVFASSIHAVLGYPPRTRVSASMPPRAANSYGISKAWGELVARDCATSGSISMLCIRIGRLIHGDGRRLTRCQHELEYSVTERDLLRLIAACIAAPATVRYGIFHGISNQSSRFDMDTAVTLLDYRPIDNVFALAWRNPRGWASCLKSQLRAGLHRLRHELHPN